ncbi:unnamed protein product [Vitrella brassicaformis CCMP3155]|uniref:Uncharacterized protein n=2 Tax=Vitrella brassicaformis TaxID=1169539 RepID=A0A0G4FA19_VITBC|nr:unnamed protein product [Vitrella brassicaformis CCMP3155]|eukprot:CEM09766.1 unnamed protein product [Vitrella brassicaformis CCMP3155]
MKCLVALAVCFVLACTSSALTLRRTSVAKCQIKSSGKDAPDTPTPSFFIPAADKKMYEEGMQQMLENMVGQAAAASGGTTDLSFKVECKDSNERDVTCAMCIYDEMSEDQTHKLVGQTLSVPLMNCMDGKFSHRTKMPNSEYHPVCYPQQKSATA